MILKYRFLTQLAPDICHKLLKQASGPDQSLDNLLQWAQAVYYGREHEEKKERQKKTKEQAETLVIAVRTVVKQPERNAQGDPGEKGWACYYCRKEGHLKRDHPKASKLHVRSARDHTGGEIAPRGIGFRGQTLRTIRTEGSWGSPHKPPS